MSGSTYWTHESFDGYVTLKMIGDAVGRISDACGDDEMAHSLEDELYAAILRAICDERCERPVAAAREALGTRNLRFERWCA